MKWSPWKFSVRKEVILIISVGVNTVLRGCISKFRFRFLKTLRGLSVKNFERRVLKCTQIKLYPRVWLEAKVTSVREVSRFDVILKVQAPGHAFENAGSASWYNRMLTTSKDFHA
jgi:hypothetical protein